MSGVSLSGVCKRYGSVSVLAELDLTVAEGSVTAVLGASGSGKTTMLRLIAGFEQLDAGSITIGQRMLDDGRRMVAPQRRGVGYVPQDGALFPHLTVSGNVAFGLPRSRRGLAHELLERVGLHDLSRRYPHQLSGGEQQRVALARALAIRPEVVLLDEPFNALDASLRAGLGREVVEILSRASTTTLLVTHDRSEALALADTVAVLAEGRIASLGDPRTLYRSPADAVAASSIGEANLLAAEFAGDRARCVLGTVALELVPPTLAMDAYCLLLRPEQLVLHLQPAGPAASATVERVYFQGAESLAYVRLDGPSADVLIARIPGSLPLSAGQSVWIEVAGAGVAVRSERPAAVDPAPAALGEGAAQPVRSGDVADSVPGR